MKAIRHLSHTIGYFYKPKVCLTCVEIETIFNKRKIGINETKFLKI